MAEVTGVKTARARWIGMPYLAHAGKHRHTAALKFGPKRPLLRGKP
jgi:hypothetical protein